MLSDVDFINACGTDLLGVALAGIASRQKGVRTAVRLSGMVPIQTHGGYQIQGETQVNKMTNTRQAVDRRLKPKPPDTPIQMLGEWLDAFERWNGLAPEPTMTIQGVRIPLSKAIDAISWRGTLPDHLWDRMAAIWPRWVSVKAYGDDFRKHNTLSFDDALAFMRAQMK